MRCCNSAALAAVLLSAMVLSATATAQDGPPSGRPSEPDGDWQFRLGALGTYGPDYEGSDGYGFDVFPLVEVEYRDRFFLSPRGGAGFYLLNDDAIELSAAIGYEFGRDEGDSDDLNGLGDVDGGATAIVSAEYTLSDETFLPGLSFGTEFRHQFTGDDTGFTLDADMGYRFPITRQIFLRPSIGAVYASGEYMDAYFGVSSVQSASSGLAAFDPGSGFKSVGGGLGLFYRFNRDWGAQLFLTYDRLVGDAADSPIVKDENQYRAALGLAYSF